MTNVVVLLFDGLGSSYLGPYGNTWLDTPACNRLAARSLLLETMLTDSNDLESIYTGLWYGRHRLQGPRLGSCSSLPEAAARHMATYFVSDDSNVADYQGAQDFEQRVIIPQPSVSTPAVAMEATQLAQLFANCARHVPTGGESLLDLGSCQSHAWTMGRSAPTA